jgi:hypothetical protein
MILVYFWCFICFQGLDTALHLAVIGNFRQICVTLLSNGANPNAVNRQGCTPLFYVSSKRVLKVLLRFGCDPLLLNKHKKSAFEVLNKQFGEDGWEFGMKDILIHAVDAMKLRRYKESIGEFDDDDGLSSINSAAMRSVSSANSSTKLLKYSKDTTKHSKDDFLLKNKAENEERFSKVLMKHSKGNISVTPIKK